MTYKDTLFNKLKNNHLEGAYPFHMPGHKRQISFTENMYQLDITEIEGFDSLHHANGILKSTSRRAAKLYQAEDTYLLVNGSTAGLLCAIEACKSRGNTLVMARNCHKAVYHGAYLGGFETMYLYPGELSEWGIYGGIAPEDVEKALDSAKDVAAVVITSPTYEGVVSDIKTIAQCCHAHQVPLIVDEAHGAHFGFHRAFPSSAITLGADCVIQSLHKTMPALTQTALLHVNGNLVDRSRIQRFFSIFQSSSPSYLLMGSIDQCITYMEECKADIFERFSKAVEECRNRLSVCKVIRLFTLSEEEKATGACFQQDFSRFVFSLQGLPKEYSGKWLMDALREEYHLELEMAGLHYATAIVTMMDTQEGLDRLCDAILQLDERLYASVTPKEQPMICAGEDKLQDENQILPQAIVRTTIAQAYDGLWKPCAMMEAKGKISAEFVYIYPPGIPIVAPGEEIRKEHLEHIAQAQELGLSVEGLQDTSLETIRVLAGENWPESVSKKARRDSGRNDM